MLTLYTVTVCPKCMLIKSALNNSGVEYEIVNLDKNEEALNKIKALGFSGVPILEKDGEYITDISKMMAFVDELE